MWIACTKSNYKNGGVFYYLKSHKDSVDHELSFQPGSSQQIPKIFKKNEYKKKYPKFKCR